LTAFLLLVVMCSTTLMSVETTGIKRTADLFSGPQELVRQNMGELAGVIISLGSPLRLGDIRTPRCRARSCYRCPAICRLREQR
jgi:hypothetical protein